MHDASRVSASFTVCTWCALSFDEESAIRVLPLRRGTSRRSVSVLFGKSEWVRRETHYNLLAPQSPAQVGFGGRKNQPSPDLRRKPHDARQIACVSLHRQDVISTDDCREEGDRDV